MASSKRVVKRGAVLDEEVLSVAAASADGGNFRVLGTDGDDLLRISNRLARAGGAVVAGQGDDLIRGSKFDDIILGDVPWFPELFELSVYGGQDRIRGGGGNDVIFGDGTEGDQFAGCGDDFIWGGPGDDVIFGDQESIVYGVRGGDDLLYGDAGNDVIRGDCRVIDRVSFGGDDEIYGGSGNDLLIGDADFIAFQGAGGNDLLDGGLGDDVLIGDGLLEIAGSSAGNDQLFGGAGNDRLYGDAPIGEDLVRLLDLSGLGRGYLEYGDMFFAAYGGDDFLDGGAGDDLLAGGAGDDAMIGGTGRDTFLFFQTWRNEYETEIDRILDFRSGEDRLDLTRWGLDGTLLDTDENGVIGEGDDAVFRDGRDLVIDLGAASGRADPDRALVILEGVAELRLDDLVPLPPATWAGIGG